MQQHERLERLKDEIGADLRPVRPFAPPGVRASRLLAAFVLFGLLVFAIVPPRADMALLGGWGSFGLSLVQVLAAAALLRVALAWSIPAMGGSTASASLWVVGALLAHLGIGAVTLEVSALSPAPGREWYTGLVCLGAITGLSLPPLVLGSVLLARGVLSRVLPVVLVAAIASGLVADAIWRLHCSYSVWEHVLPFHTGALVPVTIVALGFVAVFRLADRTTRRVVARGVRRHT